MKSLIKFLGFAVIIVLAGLWIMTVMKSCDKNKLAEVPNLETGISDKVTEVKDDVESLFEGETEEEGLFDEEGDEISGNAAGEEEGATLLDESEDEDEYEDDDEDLADLKDEIAARTNASNEDRTATSSSTNATATSTRRSSSSGIEYLVIGGAFLTEVNAKAEVRRLKKKGYDQAEVVNFDYSQYHSVCVKRTSSLNDARSTKNKLVDAGNAEAYVHKKRRGKKK